MVEVGAEVPPADVLIDAIFGTGFHGDPREEAARSIEAIRNAKVPVVAVDVPSGVNASTGEVSEVCVDATTTVTFHGEKVGLAEKGSRVRVISSSGNWREVVVVAHGRVSGGGASVDQGWLDGSLLQPPEE